MSLTEQFLKSNWDERKPLLLGYSGGPDSKALLYALLECGVKPHLAHVDHGWREESGQEALLLAKEAQELGCVFHTICLELKEKKEDEARKARLSYFASLFSEFDALLLAHQADDLAETVLKRVLEGAHLSRLSGMQPVSHQYGMKIFRPFLSLRRSDILEFLEEKNLKPLIDPSNADPIYLRARMRGEILPFLTRSFGKEMTNNLTLLSERSRELSEYLDRKLSHVPIQKGPWGTIVDLQGLEPIEQTHLLQKIARKEGIVFTRDMLKILLSGKKSASIQLKKRKILLHEGRIWLFSFPSKDSHLDG